MKKRQDKHFLASIRVQAGLTTTEYAIAGALVGLAIVLAFSDLGKTIAKAVVELAKAMMT